MQFESLEHYRDLINSLPDIIYQIDTEGRIIFISHAVSILGYTPEELEGKHFSSIVHPADSNRVSIHPVGKKPAENVSQVFFNEHRTKSDRLDTTEIRLVCRQTGETTNPEQEALVFGELSARGLYETNTSGTEQRLLGTIGIIRDISRRKKAEGFLRKLLWAVDQTPVSIIIADAKGVIEYINPHFIRTTGYTPPEVIGRKVGILKSHYHPKEFYRGLNHSLAETGEWAGELINRKKDGHYYWSSALISAVRDPQGVISNFISIQEDITERKRTAKQIKALREKEILLREIHHRVKNNLQIITSLLNLQSNSIGEERFVDIFRKCESRIKTLALIHEKLYQSQDIAKIEFGDYLKSLVFHLIQAHREQLGTIRINIEADKVYFGIDTAIPAGLIVNELITNAIFHAFPGGAHGEINIVLKHSDTRCLIEVADNGSGFTGDFEKTDGDGLGLQLVRVLVRQIKGTLKLEKKAGSLFSINLPLAD